MVCWNRAAQYTERHKKSITDMLKSWDMLSVGAGLHKKVLLKTSTVFLSSNHTYIKKSKHAQKKLEHATNPQTSLQARHCSKSACSDLEFWHMPSDLYPCRDLTFHAEHTPGQPSAPGLSSPSPGNARLLIDFDTSLSAHCNIVQTSHSVQIMYSSFQAKYCQARARSWIGALNLCGGST